jgi:rhomboid family GlyGly-CTERM serine protease
LAAVAAVLALSPAASAWLQYDRRALAAGELWRLVSGHWTHASADHFFWDVLVFVVLGVQCERVNRGRFWAAVLGSALLISAVLWYGRPDLDFYRGLSGIDSALFALLAVTQLKQVRRDRPWAAILVVLPSIAFAGKTLYEWHAAQTLFVDSVAAGMIPIVSAHIAGACAGLIVGCYSGPRGVSVGVRCEAARRCASVN